MTCDLITAGLNQEVDIVYVKATGVEWTPGEISVI